MRPKIIIVTGAANGIGAAITELALQQGHYVIATDLSYPALKAKWANTLNIRVFSVDVRQSAAWSYLIESLEKEGIEPDVLINVAGVLRTGITGELTQEDIDLTLDVNVKGVINGTNAVATGMRRRGHGHIINVGSVASLYPTPGTTLYATSKFAVRGFSLAAAGDLRPYGIAVTLFGPGPVKTDMLEQQRWDENAALTFSGKRALSKEEVAAAILGPVLKKRPLEYFLPFKDELLGKISNAFPGFFLSQLNAARRRGMRHFSDRHF